MHRNNYNVRDAVIEMPKCKETGLPRVLAGSKNPVPAALGSVDQARLLISRMLIALHAASVMAGIGTLPDGVSFPRSSPRLFTTLASYIRNVNENEPFV